MQILQIIIMFIIVVLIIAYLFFRNVDKYILENKNNLIVKEDIHRVKQFVILFYLQYLKLEIVYMIKIIFFKKDKDELERTRLILESFDIKSYKKNLNKLYKTNFKKVAEDLRGNFFGNTTVLEYYGNLGRYISSLEI